MDISAELNALPAPLGQAARGHWEHYLATGEPAAALADGGWRGELVRVWACSDFVARACCQDGALLNSLLDSGDLSRTYGAGEYRRALGAELAAVAGEAALSRVLRRFRRREMVRIAWRDLAGRAPLEETLGDVSALAAACVDLALRHLDTALAAQWGEPRGRSGARQRMVVVGMGKLGAGELNFSSDIDLIFAYPEPGQTQGGAVARSNQDYFTELGRRLIRVLDARTADGFVFRVDMRLRPFGDAGPLVAHFDALEAYYQTHGREWERYAWIKAAPVAGDAAAGARLMALLKPFVYRRYLDYSAFESLREMKALLQSQVRRKGLEDNIKLGAGGIREIEFIAQAFQLIRGGRDARLRQRALLRVLEELAAGGHLPGYVCRQLKEAYVFLRLAENRLQEYADEQTHALPTGATARLRLAHAMGFAHWDAFAAVLAGHRRRVQEHFEQVFSAPQREDGGAREAGGWAALWGAESAPAELAAHLRRQGFEDADEVARRLLRFKHSAVCRALSARGRDRLDQLMPLLLGAVAAAPRPGATLNRLLDLLAAIVRRSTYIALLAENPTALSQLVRLCAASPWISRHLARHPILLDELLDARTLYAPRSREALGEELQRLLAGLAPEDLEGRMDALRQFKQSNVLRVAAADVMGRYPLMAVSDHLTWIAEAVLETVVRQARAGLEPRHGWPLLDRGGGPAEAGFAVVGYGKLGGIELGYGSDLDLVFLYDDEGRPLGSGGARPLDNAMYFARLGQRIIHWCTAHTAGGVLYEVDMRLRPSGSAGLLVSGLGAFARYQRDSAWTWEHQALVRARVVAGDAALARRFEVVRAEVLGRPRDLAALRREVCDMRRRMRRELGRGSAERFDLKQDAGGIADIEFMVQYGVLAWARGHPQLLRYTDNIRLLDAFAQAGLLAAEDAAQLGEAYRAYRARVHQLTLQEEPAVVAAAEFVSEREAVRRIWRSVFGEDAAHA